MVSKYPPEHPDEEKAIFLEADYWLDKMSDMFEKTGKKKKHPVDKILLKHKKSLEVKAAEKEFQALHDKDPNSPSTQIKKGKRKK